MAVLDDRELALVKKTSATMKRATATIRLLTKHIIELEAENETLKQEAAALAAELNEARR
jgi:FtsZ-binding cell division protein ZapB